MLTFHLKKEWFDKIKAGEKTHEYREVKPYWDKRLKEYLYDDYNKFLPSVYLVCFLCGYPTKREIIYGTTKVCVGKIKSVKITNGLKTDLKVNKPVYDIEFKPIKENY